jgi:uncharacterized membrane protein YbaN (DUF454 family)
MNARIKRVLVLIVGWCFILLGIVGLFLPILQGVLFLLIGLIILSSEYVWAHHLLSKLRQRFPKLSTAADEAMAKAAKWLHLSRQGEGD